MASLSAQPALTLTPSGHGRGYTVAVGDRSGAPLAVCDAEGTVRGQAGEVLLHAPLRWHGRRDKPTGAALEIADASGAPIGSAKVVRYGVGPRSRKASLEIADASGAAVALLEPRDHAGDVLAIAVGGRDLTTIAVTKVKTGFLRKTRVYAVEHVAEAAEPLRTLVVAAAIRYDAVLGAVVAAAARD